MVGNYITITSFLARDHANGNEKLASMVPGLTVCGNDDRIGAMNKRVKHNEQFKVLWQIYSCDTHMIFT